MFKELSRTFMPTDFWWNERPNSYHLFEQKSVHYDYNPYYIEFLTPTWERHLRIMTVAKLNILLGVTDLLSAGLDIQHQLEVDIESDINSILWQVLEDTHRHFQMAFEERRLNLNIDQSYRLVFDEKRAEKSIIMIRDFGRSFY